MVPEMGVHGAHRRVDGGGRIKAALVERRHHGASWKRSKQSSLVLTGTGTVRHGTLGKRLLIVPDLFLEFFHLGLCCVLVIRNQDMGSSTACLGPAGH